MDKKPQRESWFLGFLKFQWTLGLAVLGGLVYEFAPKLLNHFFPRVGGFIAITIFWALALLVVIALVSSLVKVFRPNDPSDLSLK